ncbi:MAG: biotin--[acetyl-CoA-carboxylase] ligase [Elusimicrobia bacterium RIFOXYB2_FULL_49_7]|nr:MAG: biotin--[acetyl-CoA-carboxylase] ligase [Elusimicrobia bacterium RIFOXYB2_FULL_49_7]
MSDRVVTCLASVDSTNLFVRREFLAGRLTGEGVIMAVRQFAGMGTHGRTWVSDHALGLWATWYFIPSAAPLFPLLARVSLSLCRCLLKKGIQASVKWPNDVVVGRRKICGILAERIRDAAWIGFGVNLNQQVTDFPPELREKATSYRMESEQKIRPDLFLQKILEEADNLPVEETSLMSLYRAQLAGYGESLLLDQEPILLEGVEPDGTLLARHSDGNVRKHVSGTLEWRENG